MQDLQDFLEGDLMDLIPQTRDELEAEFRALSRKLEMIGLSPYEARAYIALVAHGYGNAEAIATTAQIPRTSAYKILQSLQSKGFAIAAQGRPKIYKPEAPSKIYKQIQVSLKDTFEKLELLHEIITEKGIPQLVFTITGKHKVIEKIGELLDVSTKEFLISTPVFSEIQDLLDKKIQNAVKRGVKITIITAPGQRIPKNTTVVRKSGLIATDIIRDKQEALLASPDLNACGYGNNVLLAEHMQRFIEILIEHSG